MSHDEMMQDEVNDAFWARTDAVIQLANTQCEAVEADDVNASLLYAAARFSSFLIAAQAEDRDALQQGRDDALDYFTSQFRQLLAENIDDYLENFDEYDA